MTRKLYKILAVLGISGITMFQAGSCDALAAEFARGFEIGLNGGSIEDLHSTDCGYDDGSYADDSLIDDSWNVDSWDCDSSCDLW